MSTLPTLDIPKEELQKAARQAYYRSHLRDFFCNELRIATKGLGTGMAPFIPNPAQDFIIKAAERQLREKGKIRQIIFKARQIGASTYGSGILWNRLSLYQGVNALAVAQDRTTAERLFSMYETFWRGMSDELRPPKQYHTKGFELVLGLGDANNLSDMSLFSRLLTAEGKNCHVGVGATLHGLLLSEVARYPSVDPIVESLLPACSDAPGTVRIVESTAHFGQGSDWFRDQCERAMAGKSEYEFFFVPWHLLPEYQTPLFKGEKLRLDAEEKHLIKTAHLTLGNIKWRRQKIAEMIGDVNMFRLSYPISYEEGWITKNSSAFPFDRLMEMQQYLCPPLRRFNVVEGRIFEDCDGGVLHVWKMPERDKLYDIGGDVCGGNEDGDFSVCEVIERGSNEQVAEWRGHPMPREFGDILAAIGRMYNNAQVASEINSMGASTLERLRDIYSQLYLWRKRDTVAPKLTNKVGWMTTAESKAVCVNLARERLYYRQAVIHSKTLWDELRNFIQDWTPTGLVTWRAATGYDDCCMAWMIALIASSDEDFSRFESISVRGNPFLKPQSDYIDYSVFRDNDGLFGPKNDGPRVDTRPWR